VLLLLLVVMCVVVVIGQAVSAQEHLQQQQQQQQQSQSHSPPVHVNQHEEQEEEEHYRRRLSAAAAAAVVSEKAAHQDILKANLQNFEHVSEAVVLGPTSFPKPFDIVQKKMNSRMHDNDDDDIIVTVTTHLQPALGQHRPDQDAVLLFAAEYPLYNYVLFIESLRATGYTGDIVLSVNKSDLQQADILQYLSWHSSNDRGVVVYTPRQVCFNLENEVVESAKGGIRTCVCHDLYGTTTASTKNINYEGTRVEPLEDPRPQRTLANIRYEIYWIMASNYSPQSWLLLIDARDTIFQANPFEHVPRQTGGGRLTAAAGAGRGNSGILYFFGENMQATRIGKSKANNKWIRTAYGDEVGNALSSRPIICSGASMGEQVAVEQYLRAMVSEADETGTVLMGSDQGFHNRLYYSRKLLNCNAIHDIVVFDQGTGIVNNMGALRTKALEEWGNGKICEKVPGKHNNSDSYRILNWDGTLRYVRIYTQRTCLASLGSTET
jgi:hypothetical protein